MRCVILQIPLHEIILNWDWRCEVDSSQSSQKVAVNVDVIYMSSRSVLWGLCFSSSQETIFLHYIYEMSACMITQCHPMMKKLWNIHNTAEQNCRKCAVLFLIATGKIVNSCRCRLILQTILLFRTSSENTYKFWYIRKYCPKFYDGSLW